MRKVFLLLTAATFILACNTDSKNETTTADVQVKAAKTLPYTPIYSSSFKMSDEDYSAMILQGSWKDWERGSLDNMRSWVADSVVVYHSDYTMVQGVDSLTARWKRGRAGYSSVVDSIESVMTVYSTDKKENWVLVWAKEINTTLEGKRDTSYVMETWRINKDGKADMLYQYDMARRKK